MATKLIKDFRRQDQRRYLYQPYWISSAEIVGLTLGSAESYVGLAFSFPATKYGSSIILIEKCVCQIVQAFAGGTVTVDIGSYTIATDTVTDEGTITIVDADDYIPTGSITNGTIGNYFPAAGDWLTGKLAMTEGAVCQIVPADSTVPCIGFYMTTDGTLTAGKARLHFLISEVPIVS